MIRLRTLKIMAIVVHLYVAIMSAWAEDPVLCKPEICDDGIVFGKNKLLLLPNSDMKLVSGRKTLINFCFFLSTKELSWICYQDKTLFSVDKYKNEIDVGNYEFISSFVIDKTSNRKGILRQNITLQADGSIMIDFNYDFPGDITAPTSGLFISLPGYVGGEMLSVESKDGEIENYFFPDLIKFKAKGKSMKLFQKKTIKSITLINETVDQKVEIKPVVYASLWTDLDATYGYHVRLAPDSGKRRVSFLIKIAHIEHNR